MYDDDIRINKILWDMPLECHQYWIRLNSETKKLVLAQTKFYDLRSPYQIGQFWKTRDWAKMIGIEPKRVFSSVDPYGEENWDDVVKVPDWFSENNDLGRAFE